MSNPGEKTHGFISKTAPQKTKRRALSKEGARQVVKTEISLWRVSPEKRTAKLEGNQSRETKRGLRVDFQAVEHLDELRVVVIHNAAVSHIQSVDFRHLLLGERNPKYQNSVLCGPGERSWG